MRRTTRVTFTAALVAALSMIFANLAFADVLYVNQLTTGGSSTTTAQGGSGSLEVWLDEANGDVAGDSKGCGSGGKGEEAQVTLSSNNTGVTIANAGPRKFAGCGIANKLTFTYSVSSTATGSATISGAITGGKDGAAFSTADTFTVNISASTPTDPCAGRVAPGEPTLAEVNALDATTGWYKIGSADATFAISPATNAEYKIGNGAWTAYTGEVTLNTDGQHAIAARSFLPATTSPACARIDSTQTTAEVMKVDRTAPGATPVDVTNTTWRNTPLSETFTFSDSTSGLAPNQGLTTDQFTVTASAESASATSPTIASKTITDVAGNSVTRSVSALIDTTGPTAPTASLNPTPNTAGWNNAHVTVSFSGNGDNLSGVASCTADSVVSTEAAGQTVNGTCTDNAGNTSSTTTASVNLDKSVPTISDMGANAAATGQNGWYLTAVTNRFEATDTLSGFLNTLTNPWGVSTGTAEGSAVTVSSGIVSDKAGNPATAINSAAFKIDLSDPTNVQFVGGPADGSSHYFGAVPAAPTCTADDAISDIASCNVTGRSTALGTHTLTATATDNAGRTATTTRSYTVLAWNTRGFFSPVDMSGVLNTVKGGSTVPLKFEVFAGAAPAGEFTTTSAIGATLSYNNISCTSGSVDEIEVVSSGSTTLRYDDTAGQFIYNWKTPTGSQCYKVNVTLADGTKISANFKTR